jgi:hypothetical protein
MAINGLRTRHRASWLRGVRTFIPHIVSSDDVPDFGLDLTKTKIWPGGNRVDALTCPEHRVSDEAVRYCGLGQLVLSGELATRGYLTRLRWRIVDNLPRLRPIVRERFAGGRLQSRPHHVLWPLTVIEDTEGDHMLVLDRVRGVDVHAHAVVPREYADVALPLRPPPELVPHETTTRHEQAEHRDDQRGHLHTAKGKRTEPAVKADRSAFHDRSSALAVSDPKR